MRIDIHTHVLPFMDDGPQNLKDAKNLTELLHNQGIEVAVCTPHFNPYIMDKDLFIQNRIAAEFSFMDESKVSLIMGSETYLHESLLYYNSLDFLCIQNTKYLLIELPLSRHSIKRIMLLLQELINKYDIIPIIAHIERYQWIHRGYLEKLKTIGCVIQINTSSFIKRQYRQTVIGYIKKGLVDVLGSDCHDSQYRPPIIKDAINCIEQMIGHKACSILLLKSEDIIRGRDIRKY